MVKFHFCLRFLGCASGDLLIAIEAKNLDAPMNIWQAIAYAGILHKNRKLKRENAVSFSYGLITDSKLFRFFRISHDGKVTSSVVLDAMSGWDESKKMLCLFFM